MSSLGANLQDPADLPSAEALVRSGNESIVVSVAHERAGSLC